MRDVGSRVMKLLCVAFFVIFIDFVSKDLTRNFIPLMDDSALLYPYGGIPIFHNWHGIDFSINFVMNKGGAWGILANHHSALLTVRVIVIATMLIYVFFFHLFSERAIPMILIIAGALGNVIDCFLYGHVIDMLYFVLWGYSYPVFNVADSAIVLGVFGMIFQWFFSKRYRRSKGEKQQKMENGSLS